MTQKLSLLLTLVLFLLSCPLSLFALYLPERYDFAAINSDGVTIYYEILSSTTCELSYGPIGYPKHINIPATVTYNEKTYSVTQVDFFYFTESDVNSITIPSSVTSICWSLTYNDNLAFVTIDSDNPNYSSLDGVIFDKDQSTLIYFPPLKEGEYAIPNSVTSIGERAFTNSSLSSLTIPNSVTSISDFAFLRSSLTSITLPSGLTSIERGVFLNCGGLTSITLPSSLTSIGESAFYGCSSLTSITLPNSITSIGDGAFYRNSSLSSIINLQSVPFDATMEIMDWDEETGEEYPTKESIFSEISEKCILYVLPGCKEKYESEPGWNVFSQIVELTAEELVSNLNNTLYASDTDGRAGDEVSIPISMKNEVIATGYSFSLELPAAIDPNTVSIKKSTARKAGEVSLTKAVQTDGTIKVVAYTTDGQPFSGNNGEVATVAFNIPQDMPDGDYDIVVKNVEISQNGTAIKPNVPVTSKLLVEHYELGDANGDSDVSVSDLSVVVNYILDLENEVEVNVKAMDANKDGNVSVSDLSTIVNIILFDDPKGAATAKQRGENKVAFSSAPFCIAPGQEATLYLALANDADINAFQFDALLPDGLTCTGIQRTSRISSEHSISSSAVDDATRVLCYSPSNSAILDNAGTLVALTIKADELLMTGSYTMQLHDIEVVDARYGIHLDDMTIRFDVVDATVIETIHAPQAPVIRYDLMGRPISAPQGLYIENEHKNFIK